MVTLNHLSHMVQFNLPCDRHVKHSVTYICFACEFAVQFNTEDFHCRNLCKGEIVWKYWIWLPGISVPLKSSMSESWKWSFPSPTVTCGKSYKAVKLAVCLSLVCNWTPCGDDIRCYVTISVCNILRRTDITTDNLSGFNSLMSLRKDLLIKKSLSHIFYV